MLRSFTVKNFRCFKDLTIEPLERVNLIAGKNNVGKTALLEAIFMFIGAPDIRSVIQVGTSRGFDGFKREDATFMRELFWKSLFWKLNREEDIQLIGSLGASEQHNVTLAITPKGGPARVAIIEGQLQSLEIQPPDLFNQTLQLWYKKPSGETQTIVMFVDQGGIRVTPVLGQKDAQGEPPPLSPLLPGFFLTARRHTTFEEDAVRLGRLELAKTSYNLLETLKLVEPRLQRLGVIYGAGGPMIHGDIGLDQMLPLPLMGEGLGRLTSLLLTIANAPHGVILIDELENGFHYSLLSKVWQAIGDAARRFDTQIFATTHSWECIWNAHRAFVESGTHDDFRLHRLDRINDEISVVTYDREKLETSIAMGLEVR